jgi:hypothetical protein
MSALSSSQPTPCRRTEERTPIVRSSTVRNVDAAPYDVTIENLSRKGFSFTSDTVVAVGGRIKVGLAGAVRCSLQPDVERPDDNPGQRFGRRRRFRTAIAPGTWYQDRIARCRPDPDGARRCHVLDDHRNDLIASVPATVGIQSTSLVAMLNHLRALVAAAVSIRRSRDRVLIGGGARVDGSPCAGWGSSSVSIMIHRQCSRRVSHR